MLLISDAGRALALAVPGIADSESQSCRVLAIHSLSTHVHHSESHQLPGEWPGRCRRLHCIMAERERRPKRRDVDAGKEQSRGEHHGIEHQGPIIAYIKSVLCAQPQSAASTADATLDGDSDLASDTSLPPLTSSNAVDVQLYAFIAVILSNFVQIWYNRITPDQQFVSEIVQIIAHCTRGLEQRLRHVDLETLVLDEVPRVFIEHIEGQ